MLFITEHSLLIVTQAMMVDMFNSNKNDNSRIPLRGRVILIDCKAIE